MLGGAMSQLSLQHHVPAVFMTDADTQNVPKIYHGAQMEPASVRVFAIGVSFYV